METSLLIAIGNHVIRFWGFYLKIVLQFSLITVILTRAADHNHLRSLLTTQGLVPSRIRLWDVGWNLVVRCGGRVERGIM